MEVISPVYTTEDVSLILLLRLLLKKMQKYFFDSHISKFEERMPHFPLKLVSLC